MKELVKRGHDLGNHSEHHYDMTTISQEEKDSELKTVHDKVKKLTGYEMYLFRPPYGAYDNDVIKTRTPCIIIRFSGQWIVWIGRIMVWILLSRRFATIKHLHREHYPTVTMEQVYSGCIGCHADQFRGTGYKIVPISKLIMKKNYHMDATGKQIAMMLESKRRRRR